MRCGSGSAEADALPRSCVIVVDVLDTGRLRCGAGVRYCGAAGSAGLWRSSRSISARRMASSRLALYFASPASRTSRSPRIETTAPAERGLDMKGECGPERPQEERAGALV